MTLKTKLKEKKCKVCETVFMLDKPMQKVCGPLCAYKLVQIEKEKKSKKEYRAAKQKLNEQDRKWWLKKAQDEFNKFIRLRDKDLPCISCGITYGQMHAGHYRSIGATREALRYNEDNCHKQCAQCNNFKSGSIGEYRIRLIHKIGVERVEAIEKYHEPKTHTIEELREIRDTYKAKSKAIETGVQLPHETNR